MLLQIYDCSYSPPFSSTLKMAPSVPFCSSSNVNVSLPHPAVILPFPCQLLAHQHWNTAHGFHCCQHHTDFTLWCSWPQVGVNRKKSSAISSPHWTQRWLCQTYRSHYLACKYTFRHFRSNWSCIFSKLYFPLAFFPIMDHLNSINIAKCNHLLQR